MRRLDFLQLVLLIENLFILQENIVKGHRQRPKDSRTQIGEAQSLCPQHQETRQTDSQRHREADAWRKVRSFFIVPLYY